MHRPDGSSEGEKKLSTRNGRRRVGVVGFLTFGLIAAACAGPAGGTSGDQTADSASGESGNGVAAAGMGSPEALASPGCDPQTKRTSGVSKGAGPLCVKPWHDGDDNGGATAQGVTATEVKVVGYLPNEAMYTEQKASGQENSSNDRATGQRAPYQQLIADFQKAYEQLIAQNHTFQTWGRKPVFDVVLASGPDEAAQRADAVKVLAEEPFMVLDAANQSEGAPYFDAAIANADVVVLGTLDQNAKKQEPYRWGAQSNDAFIYLAASFIAQSLAGKPAKYAGDSLQAKDRSFGVVHPKDDWSDDDFTNALKAASAPAMAASIEVDTKNPDVQSSAPTIVTKLKQAGVTSVVLQVPPTIVGSLMSAATAQDYEPEWIYTGFGFQEFNLFPRSFDATQVKHLFGLATLPPPVATDTVPANNVTSVVDWYWGPKKGVFGAVSVLWPEFVYSALHYAGPDLTAQNIRDGLFAVPAVSGAASGTTQFQTAYGRSSGLPTDQYASLGGDRALIYWNPTAKGGVQAIPGLEGTGMMSYLNGGKRYAYGNFPKDPEFFTDPTATNTVSYTSAFPGGTLPTPIPCNGCPSSQ
jgi:hypothetical protein